MGKIVYVCGAIKADKEYKDKFLLTQKLLERKGFTVINPTLLPADMPFKKYMPICLAMLEQADVLCVIRDGLDSKGVDLELNYAKYQRKDIMYIGLYDNFEEVESETWKLGQ